MRCAAALKKEGHKTKYQACFTHVLGEKYMNKLEEDVI